MTTARRVAPVLLVLAATLPFLLGAEESPPATESVTTPRPDTVVRMPFVGERLTYEFGWNGIGAADVTVRIDPEEYLGRPAVHIQIDMRTKPQIDWIWKMRDRIDAFAEVGTWRPLRYSFQQHESTFEHDTEVIFDHAVGRATAIRRHKGNVKVDSIPCQGVYDPITALMQMRITNAKVGEQRDLLVYDGKRVHTIRYVVEGEEDVETEMGTVRARKVHPWIEKSDPPVHTTDYSKTKVVRRVTGWVGMPGDPLLYRIESAIYVGRVYGELLEAGKP
jgi:hypothetical protein